MLFFWKTWWLFLKNWFLKKNTHKNFFHFIKYWCSKKILTKHKFFAGKCTVFCETYGHHFLEKKYSNEQNFSFFNFLHLNFLKKKSDSKIICNPLLSPLFVPERTREIRRNPLRGCTKKLHLRWFWCASTKTGKKTTQF